MSFGTFTKKRKQENKLIRSKNKNKQITNKLKGAILDNGTKILMVSKLNIFINPCTKIISCQVQQKQGSSPQGLGFSLSLNFKENKEKWDLKSDLTKANTKNKKASKLKSNQI